MYALLGGGAALKTCYLFAGLFGVSLITNSLYLSGRASLVTHRQFYDRLVCRMRSSSVRVSCLPKMVWATAVFNRVPSRG